MWGVNRKLFHVKPVVSVSAVFRLRVLLFHFFPTLIWWHNCCFFTCFVLISHVPINVWFVDVSRFFSSFLLTQPDCLCHDYNFFLLLLFVAFFIIIFVRFFYGVYFVDCHSVLLVLNQPFIFILMLISNGMKLFLYWRFFAFVLILLQVFHAFCRSLTPAHFIWTGFSQFFTLFL